MGYAAKSVVSPTYRLTSFFQTSQNTRDKRHPRDLRRRDLVVDRVAQRLEVGALPLDGAREIARLADPTLVVPHEEAPLQLVGQQVVTRLAEALERIKNIRI